MDGVPKNYTSKRRLAGGLKELKNSGSRQRNLHPLLYTGLKYKAVFADTFSDPELLDRATQLRRLFFTFDDDLLSEATKRQRENKPFSGVIYGHPMRVFIGQCIKDLELLAKAGDPEDL